MTAAIAFSEPCPQCGGTGVEAQGWQVKAAGHVVTTCPDCHSGMVPDDGTVEAAAESIWLRRHSDTPYRPGRARHNEYHDDYIRDAIAALVAAARYQSERET